MTRLFSPVTPWGTAAKKKSFRPIKHFYPVFSQRDVTTLYMLLCLCSFWLAASWLVFKWPSPGSFQMYDGKRRYCTFYMGPIMRESKTSFCGGWATSVRWMGHHLGLCGLGPVCSRWRSSRRLRLTFFVLSRLVMYIIAQSEGAATWWSLLKVTEHLLHSNAPMQSGENEMFWCRQIHICKH